MSAPERVELSPITLSVIEGALVSVVNEMDLRLMRAAMSPIVSEAKDMANCFFRAQDAEMIAQGSFGLPIFVAQMRATVRVCMDAAEKRGGLNPGDIWMTNDVYQGGTHLNDVQLVMPFFHEGKLEGMLASSAHWQDIGGSTGGWAPDATEVFQEGIQIPPCLLHEQGRPREDLVDLILANVRMPDDLRGDLVAMVTALKEGTRALDEVYRTHTPDLLRAAIERLGDRSEVMVRNRIEAIPDGRYTFVDYIDNDGITADAIRVAVALEVVGDEMVVDFASTDAAVRGPMGMSRSTTEAGVDIALRHVFPDLPVSGGSLRPISIRVPAGSCLDAPSPHPTSGYLEVLGKVIDVVSGALSKALPDQVPAASFGTSGIVTVSGRQPGTSKFFAVTLLYPGGYGGGPWGDGLVNGPTPQSMARTLGVELVERRYPLHFEFFRLREGSGGAGRFRGGCGTEYTVRVLVDGCDVTTVMDRHDHRPFGVLGGEDGAANDLVITREGKEWNPRIPGKVTRLSLGAGDTVHCGSPGGGGYGPPAERDPAAVERDIRLQYVEPTTSGK